MAKELLNHPAGKPFAAAAQRLRTVGHVIPAYVDHQRFPFHLRQRFQARSNNRLVGYARVALAPGESRRVAFSLHADRTAFTGVDLTRIVEPGWFTLWVGDDSEDDRLSARFRIAGDLRRIEGDRVLVTPVTLS